MENKVKSIHEARTIFDLLGIKDVTKDWQSKKGTQVFELPFKTMYANGYSEINRFSIYKSGYVRKMLVNKEGASWCCYQLNRVRKVHKFVKNYVWNDEKRDSVWDGNYRKIYNNERIMIPNHEDRLVYLCNYILKNYYRKQTGTSFYRVNDYQVSLMERNSNSYYKNQDHQLPFVDNAVNRILEDSIDVQSEDAKHGISPNHKIQVIINGHRYNLT